MGWLSKKWKGLKKTVKKIGKGIKKVFNKVMGAVGKLGIVGQIGMMLLMPYATGALTSFFGASGTLSTWAGGLMKSANIGAKALGHGLNVIQKAASFAGKVYTTVSDTIGNALDRVGNAAQGKGFNLSADRTSVFAQGNDRSLFSKDIPKSSTVRVQPTTGTVPDIKINNESILNKDVISKGIDIENQLSVSVPRTLGLEPVSTEGYLNKYFEQDYLDATNFVKEKAVEKVVGEDNLLDKILDIPSNLKDRVKNISTDDMVDFGQQELSNVVLSGSRAAGSQKVAEALGYEQITPVSYNINLDNAMGGNTPYRAVFDEIDYTTTTNGNSFYTGNVANSNYLNDIIMPQNVDYQAYMNQMSTNFYYGQEK